MTLDGSASYNPKGTALTYKWTAQNGIVLNSTSSVKPIFTAPEVTQDTQYTFSLVVNDGSVASPKDEVTITVRSVRKANQIPIADAGQDRIVNSSQLVSLYGGASIDPDGDNLRFKWTVPEGILLSATNVANPTFIAPEVLQDTQFTFELVVNDGTVDSPKDQIIISVTKGWNGCLIDTKSTEIPNIDALGSRKGQSFTAQHTGALDKIKLTVWKTSVDPYLILREWVSDEYDHAFDGQILATSNIAPEIRATYWDQNSYQEMWNFIFPSQPKLEVGQKYLFECREPMNCGVGINGKGNYVGGRAYTQNSTPESDMQFEIHICSVTNSLPISNAGLDQSVVEGTIVTLDGSTSTDPDGNLLTYKWTAPVGITLSSLTTAKPTFIAPNVSMITTYTFSLVVNDGILDSPVDQVTIVVNPLPANAGTITGTSTICQGQNSVNYTVPTIDNATSYIWTLPTGATGTSNTSSITVNYGTSAASGNITVKGTNTCGNGTTSTLAITVNILPASAGTITGAATVCQGQNSVTYTVPAITNATSYIWTLPTGASGTSATNSITVNYGASAVSGNITVKGHNSCGDGAESTLLVTVKTGVIPNIIAKWGDVLICTNLGDLIASYQWYNGSSTISGAIIQYYATNKQLGTYKVETIDKNGCKNSSNAIVISGTKSLTAYPNPASVSFTLKLNDVVDGRANISIFNSAGIKVIELQAENINEELLKEIAVNNLDDGIYVVQMKLNQKELYYTKMIVKK